jgi:hypothetical protein
MALLEAIHAAQTVLINKRVNLIITDVKLSSSEETVTKETKTCYCAAWGTDENGCICCIDWECE